MPNDFYVLTFIEALNSAFPIWADQWRHAARDTTKPITLTMLYNDATDKAQTEIESQKRRTSLYMLTTFEVAAVATVVTVTVEAV